MFASLLNLQEKIVACCHDSPESEGLPEWLMIHRVTRFRQMNPGCGRPLTVVTSRNSRIGSIHLQGLNADYLALWCFSRRSLIHLCTMKAKSFSLPERVDQILRHIQGNGTRLPDGSLAARQSSCHGFTSSSPAQILQLPALHLAGLIQGSRFCADAGIRHWDHGNTYAHARCL